LPGQCVIVYLSLAICVFELIVSANFYIVLEYIKILRNSCVFVKALKSFFLLEIELFYLFFIDLKLPIRIHNQKIDCILKVLY